MAFKPNLFIFASEEEQDNLLLQYLQQQNPEILERVARSASADIKQIIAQNVRGLVGTFPSEEFNVQISTDRENMAQLLASAMMTGYFLRQIEQRMELDTSLDELESL